MFTSKKARKEKKAKKKSLEEKLEENEAELAFRKEKEKEVEERLKEKELEITQWEKEYRELELDAPSRKKVLEKAKWLMKQLNECKQQRDIFFKQSKSETKKGEEWRKELLEWLKDHPQTIIDENSTLEALEHVYFEWEKKMKDPLYARIEYLLNNDTRKTFKEKFYEVRKYWDDFFDDSDVCGDLEVISLYPILTVKCAKRLLMPYMTEYQKTIFLKKVNELESTEKKMKIKEAERKVDKKKYSRVKKRMEDSEGWEKAQGEIEKKNNKVIKF